MNQQFLRVAHFAFATTLWVIFGLCLWRMGFSLGSLANFGQHLGNSSTFEFTEPDAPNGLGYSP